MDECSENTVVPIEYITPIEDLNEAIALAESVNWNLQPIIVMEYDGKEEDIISVISNPPETDSVVDLEDGSEYEPSEAGSDASNESQRKGPLIPEEMEDELRGSVMFIDKYTAIFGQVGPNFYAGTLQDAVKAAFSQPACKKRLLGIYLHHYDSILTNIFCAHLLAYDKVLNLLEPNFLIWGWDVTVPWNMRMYHESVERCLGKTVKDVTQHLSKERYPVFLGVSRFKSKLETKMVVYGNVGVEEFLTSLRVSVEEFKEMQEEEAREEEARAARQKLRAMQDEAYKESLEIDRAKAETKRRKLINEAEEKERRKVEEEQDCASREVERLSAESRLPEEPSSSKDAVRIKFRPPSGPIFQRVFLLSNNLEVVFTFLLSRGFRLKEFRVLAGWPRKDLSVIPKDVLLRDVGFSPQETIILELR